MIQCGIGTGYLFCAGRESWIGEGTDWWRRGEVVVAWFGRMGWVLGFMGALGWNYSVYSASVRVLDAFCVIR